MSLAHFNAFLADLTTINPDIRLTAAESIFQRESSLRPLVLALQAEILHPAPKTRVWAKATCNNDPRVRKYAWAIDRLVSAWGHGGNYPAPMNLHGVAARTAQRAFARFDELRDMLPALIQPDLVDVMAFITDVFAFNPGNQYLLRINMGGFDLDITARSLLLRAGLAPPEPAFTDNGYMNQLRLTRTMLRNMRGSSILDVGCGGALFAAEMRVLYNCIANGADLNAAQIPAAIPEGQRRYARAMLYLKLACDMGILNHLALPPDGVRLVSEIAPHIPAIIQSYHNHPPVHGDVFALAANQADHVVSMYMLCYFTNVQQTNAVLSMCGAARRSVLLFSGLGAVLNPNLNYDQGAVRLAHPNCQIDVIAPNLHRIRLA